MQVRGVRTSPSGTRAAPNPESRCPKCLTECRVPEYRVDIMTVLGTEQTTFITLATGMDIDSTPYSTQNTLGKTRTALILASYMRLIRLGSIQYRIHVHRTPKRVYIKQSKTLGATHIHTILRTSWFRRSLPTSQSPQWRSHQPPRHPAL